MLVHGPLKSRSGMMLTNRDEGITVLRERGEIFSRSRAPDGGRAVALCRP